jgi:hypothetical protein
MKDDTFGGYVTEESPVITAQPLRWQTAFQAAMMVWWLYAALAVVDVFTIGLSFPFTFGFQLLLSLLAGYAAGWLLKRQPDGDSWLRFGSTGAIAGLIIPVMSTLATILLGLIFGFATMGVTLLGGALSCVCLPLTVFACAMLGALGGKVYQWMWVS